MSAARLETVVDGVEGEQGAGLSPEQIFEQARRRETALSRVLILFIAAGLAYMLLPGTFLGVWNLFAISSREAAGSVSPAWIQAHGHAQIFGWVLSFILGIGFYSLPKLRGGGHIALRQVRVCWALWTAAVALRWLTNVYLWQWRILLPLSAGLEAAAFLIFFRAVAGHRPPPRPDAAGRPQPSGFEAWSLLVIGATGMLMLMLLANLGESVRLALSGAGPAFPPAFDQRFLLLAAWGCLVPFVWGFSAKWLPVFLGLKPIRGRLLLAAFFLEVAGVGVGIAGRLQLAAALMLIAAVLAVLALRLFVGTERPPKTRGVHPSFPVFIRMAYVWLWIAAALGVWAAWSDAAGIWGASRHALTVGFIAMMIFAVGQRILPAFSGMRLLYSTRLMFAALGLLALGCPLRVGAEILAYQGYWAHAWACLPVSAVIELSAVTLFALNLGLTFLLEPVGGPEYAAIVSGVREKRG